MTNPTPPWGARAALVALTLAAVLASPAPLSAEDTTSSGCPALDEAWASRDPSDIRRACRGPERWDTSQCPVKDYFYLCHRLLWEAFGESKTPGLLDLALELSTEGVEGGPCREMLENGVQASRIASQLAFLKGDLEGARLAQRSALDAQERITRESPSACYGGGQVDADPQRRWARDEENLLLEELWALVVGLDHPEQPALARGPEIRQLMAEIEEEGEAAWPEGWVDWRPVYREAADATEPALAMVAVGSGARRRFKGESGPPWEIEVGLDVIALAADALKDPEARRAAQIQWLLSHSTQLAYTLAPLEPQRARAEAYVASVLSPDAPPLEEEPLLQADVGLIFREWLRADWLDDAARVRLGRKVHGLQRGWTGRLNLLITGAQAADRLHAGEDARALAEGAWAELQASVRPVEGGQAGACLEMDPIWDHRKPGNVVIGGEDPVQQAAVLGEFLPSLIAVMRNQGAQQSHTDAAIALSHALAEVGPGGCAGGGVSDPSPLSRGSSATQPEPIAVPGSAASPLQDRVTGHGSPPSAEPAVSTTPPSIVTLDLTPKPIPEFGKRLVVDDLVGDILWDGPRSGVFLTKDSYESAEREITDRLAEQNSAYQRCSRDEYKELASTRGFREAKEKCERAHKSRCSVYCGDGHLEEWGDYPVCASGGSHGHMMIILCL